LLNPHNTTAHNNTVVDSAAIATTTATAITVIATFGYCFTGQLAKYAGCNVTLFIHGFNLIHTTFKQTDFAMLSPGYLHMKYYPSIFHNAQ